MWKVAASESGQKLGAFLKLKMGSQYSARQIKSAVERNACTINGRIQRFVSMQVGEGDCITFAAPVQEGLNQKSVILYEDDYFLALDKPAGFSSEDPQLAPKSKLILLHRLDKDTTGILLWAKSDACAKSFEELFRQREIKKVYLALVAGVPNQKSGHIENYLGKIHHYQGQSLWGSVPKGLLAITDWQIQQKIGRLALLKCMPTTGRTHQIRVHLSEMGFPIIGDRQYSKKEVTALSPSRCMLHASKVEFTHPILGTFISIESPLAADFQRIIHQLSRS